MDKDESFDRLAKRTLRAAPAASGSACLDAETLAAWSSGTLPAAQHAAAEAHLADCSRCLSVLAALAETVPAQTPVRFSWFSWRWVAPLATATAGAGIVVLLQRPAPAPPQDQVAAAPPAAEAPAPEALESKPFADAQTGNQSAPAERRDRAAPARSRAAAPPPAAPVAKSAEESQLAETRRDQASGFVAGRGGGPPATGARDFEAARAAPAPPPPPVSSPMPVAGAAADVGQLRRAEASVVRAPIEISSPDPAVRWRISGNAVVRSTDAGRTFQPQEIAAPERLTAGASPDANVCWIAGANGLVLLTDDGRTWRAVTRPAVVDLVGITAVDALTATVTAADGRVYRTTDAGRTWVLQESSRAPF